MGGESGPSAEEMGLKPEETRIVSDGQLIQGGARMKPGVGLELTKKQLRDAEREMEVQQYPETREYNSKMNAVKAKVDELESLLNDSSAKVDLADAKTKLDDIQGLRDELQKEITSGKMGITEIKRTRNAQFENDMHDEFDNMDSRVRQLSKKYVNLPRLRWHL